MCSLTRFGFEHACATEMLGLGFTLALVAGFFAAIASVFSKLAFEKEGATLRHYACLFLMEELCTSVSFASFASQELPITGHHDGTAPLSCLCTGGATSEDWLLLPVAVEQCSHVDTVCESTARLWLHSWGSCGQQCQQLHMHSTCWYCGIGDELTCSFLPLQPHMFSQLQYMYIVLSCISKCRKMQLMFLMCKHYIGTYAGRVYPLAYCTLLGGLVACVHGVRAYSMDVPNRAHWHCSLSHAENYQSTSRWFGSWCSTS